MTNVIVSGMRPSGHLHIGHYIGALKNWVKLQETHKCYFFLADWHALTSHYMSTEVIRESRYEYVKGWLAAGIDPNKATIYNQSEIPEVLNLFELFLVCFLMNPILTGRFHCYLLNYILCYLNWMSEFRYFHVYCVL